MRSLSDERAHGKRERNACAHACSMATRRTRWLMLAQLMCLKCGLDAAGWSHSPNAIPRSSSCSRRRVARELPMQRSARTGHDARRAVAGSGLSRRVGGLRAARLRDEALHLAVDHLAGVEAVVDIHALRAVAHACAGARDNFRAAASHARAVLSWQASGRPARRAPVRTRWPLLSNIDACASRMRCAQERAEASK